MSEFKPIFAITPGVQSYEWGKRGSDSLTAQLAEVCVEGFKVDEDKTYAEVSPGIGWEDAVHDHSRNRLQD
jgi:hypothetical protein